MENKKFKLALKYILLINCWPLRSLTGKGIEVMENEVMEREYSKGWFDQWFDSPYYHLLYKNRDFKEAHLFTEKLIQYFQFKAEDKILDLACGKGRYAIQLNKEGFDLTGVDLSPQSIAAANKLANERLHFYQHDMRQVFRANAFDYVLNIFTSFGYFDTDAENQQVISSAACNLKKGGKFLIDFLNPDVVSKNMILRETKGIEGIKFHISREINEEQFILKNIQFEDQGQEYSFQEKVKAVSKADFEKYFKVAGLTIKNLFGDYQLGPFDAEKSERMIFIAEKI